MRRRVLLGLPLVLVAGCTGDPDPATPAVSPSRAPVTLGDLLDVVVAADGTLVLADRRGGRLLRRDPAGALSLLVALPNPRDLVRGPGGEIYVASDARVVRVEPGGATRVIATLAANVLALSLAADGMLYAVEDGVRVHRIDPAGQRAVAVVAGSGQRGYAGDGGPAAAAKLDEVHAILALPGGRLLVADSANHRLRLVTADGTIATVGGDGSPASTGDGGPLRAAGLNLPSALGQLPDGTVLLADFGNDRLRRLGPAGSLGPEATIDTYAEIPGPGGFDVGPDGTVYIASLARRTLLRVDPATRAVGEVPTG